MTDYFEPHHSTYESHQYDHYQHGQGYPGTSLSYTGDPQDENLARRSATHGPGSHHSHSQSLGSVSASTRSWVYSNQVHHPLPPMDNGSVPGHTPFHGSRPLPDPQMHHQQQFIRRPFQYDDVLEEEEEGDYMAPDAQLPGNMQYDYGFQQERPTAPVRYIPAGPFSLDSAPSTPGLDPQVPTRSRSFAGGLFNSLKRLPRMFRGSEKRRLVRRGTFGTEATTATAFTTGNTLPRYLSNPSIGPSNPQFAHRLSQAVANGALPADVTSAAFQLRPPLVSPQQPILTVTPPSDGVPEEEQQAEYFDGPTSEQHHQRHTIVESSEHHTTNPNPMERTTVMVYNRDSEAPTITQAPPRSSVPMPPATVQAPTAPRVSYPAELPTRANVQAQAQTESFPGPAGPSNSLLASPPRRRPTPHNISLPPQPTPRGIRSPTSAYTVTTATSYYDPSFSSDLGPVEKFFKAFYHLPWISQGRVTVDYRPDESPRAKGKIKSLKKPMSSWYHALMSRSRRNSLDLLSSNAGTVTSDARTNSNVLSSLASPISRRSARSSTRRHHHPSHNQYYQTTKHHRSRRRRTGGSSSTGGMSAAGGAGAHTQRSASPIVPTVYPYTVPPYPPYTYPYMPYPGYSTMPVPMPLQQGAGDPSSSRSPKGPRAARSHRRTGGGSGVKYPHGGYAPFQPLAMPPPPPHMPPPPGHPQAGGMYFIAPSPPGSQNGEMVQMPMQMQMPGQALNVPNAANGMVPQFSPMVMQYVPATYRQQENGNSGSAAHNSSGAAMVSPPTTPQRPSATPHPT